MLKQHYFELLEFAEVKQSFGITQQNEIAFHYGLIPIGNHTSVVVELDPMQKQVEGLEPPPQMLLLLVEEEENFGKRSGLPQEHFFQFLKDDDVSTFWERNRSESD
jgi:hypothetical protein